MSMGATNMLSNRVPRRGGYGSDESYTGARCRIRVERRAEEKADEAQTYQTQRAATAQSEEMKAKVKRIREAVIRKEEIEVAARISEADAAARRAEAEKQKLREAEMQKMEKAQAEERQKQEEKQKEEKEAQEKNATAVTDDEEGKTIVIDDQQKEGALKAEKQTKEITKEIAEVGKGDDEEWTVLPAVVGGEMLPHASGKEAIKPVETDRQRTARLLDLRRKINAAFLETDNLAALHHYAIPLNNKDCKEALRRYDDAKAAAMEALRLNETMAMEDTRDYDGDA